MVGLRSLGLGRTRVVSFAVAMVVGCASPQPTLEGGSGTEDGESTTSGSSSSSSSGAESSSSSSSGALDESTAAEEPAPTSCHDPRPIPPSRFDCSGADGVAPLSVIIEGDEDPSILEGVRRVEGSIRIHRTDLTNLDFMGCVEEVTGDVMIHDNDALTNLDGLWNLRSIGTNFVFDGNDALTDFDGLPNVMEMNGTLMIQDNASLEVITGFHSLAGLLGELDRNGWGLYTGNLSIRGNPVLRSMDGLGGLMVVLGVFAVTHNPSLCISSINCVGSGIVEPATPREDWTTLGNDEGC